MAFAYDSNIADEDADLECSEEDSNHVVDRRDDFVDKRPPTTSSARSNKRRRDVDNGEVDFYEESIVTTTSRGGRAPRITRISPIATNNNSSHDFVDDDGRDHFADEFGDVTAEESTNYGRNVYLKCNHAGPHFTRRFVEDSLKRHKVSIVMNPPSRSIVWSFCGCAEIDKKLCSRWIVCTVCKEIFSRTESMTSPTAKRHIESLHTEIVAAVKETAVIDGVYGQISMIDTGDRTTTVRLMNEDDLVEEIDDEVVPKAKRSKKSGNYERAASFRDEYDDDDEDTTPPPLSRFPKIRRSKSSYATNDAEDNSTHCAACNIDFRNMALAIMHRNAHGKGSRFQCSQCHIVFGTVFDFWAHIFSRTCRK